MVLVLLAAALAVGCGTAPRGLQATVKAAAAADEAMLAATDVPNTGLDGEAAQPLPRGAEPAPADRPGRWLAVTNHNHSTYWDGSKPLTLMQSEAYLANFDAMVLTDHNTMRGCQSPEFKNPPHGLIMVPGMEWGAFRERGETVVGHAGLLGMDGTTLPATNLGLDGMLAVATQQHALVIANHPFCWHNSWAAPEPQASVNAVEVWNGWWYRVEPIMHNDKALAWWETALRKGRHLTAVAGTDDHGDNLGNINRNCNMVFAETPDAAGILAGIRAGHVSITSSTKGARLFLEADRDGDGSYESIMGDTVPPPAGGKLAVRAHVLAGDGKQLVLYTRKGRVAILPIKGNDATIATQVPVDGENPDYVRAEVRAHPHLPWSMSAIGNPIYVSAGGSVPQAALAAPVGGAAPTTATAL